MFNVRDKKRKTGQTGVPAASGNPMEQYAASGEMDNDAIDVQARELPGIESDAETPITPRDPYIPEHPGESEPQDKVDLFKGRPIAERDAPVREVVKRRHTILMESLEEEAERQAEERQQAQIDHEYYDHQQWTQEEARVLMDRGQAPLVFNEARGSIDWLVGTERRLRKDYKIRPRSPEDEPLAETKTKLFKYVDDANNAPWHRSLAFKQAAISGLGWLEEGISLDPEKEMIYAGSEDWRRVYRDSRGREFDQSDWRYTHRRKIVDLDFACMLLPKSARHLMAIAGRWDAEDEATDDVWYLGQHLTSAHAHGWGTQSDALFGDEWTVRRAGSARTVYGRRNSVEIIETFYRVPERVKVFADGPFFRRIVNEADPQHAQALSDKLPYYETVKWRMRVMVGTKYEPCWDGPSPYRHGQFTLIPIWGYRRGRDGMAYGAMRGMRDPQDDLNKRRSKALFALSSNQLTVNTSMLPAEADIEDLREEAARADGILAVAGPVDQAVRKEKFMGDVQANLEMAEADRIAIRNAGGVTGDNRGESTSAMSGRAIIAKQEQGSLTTFELFDNFLLAFKMAGQRRMANIEQFCNQPWQVRIDPQGVGIPEWLKVNQLDPRTGQYLNDITASQADFIVDQQDYRATLTQSAMESMFDLLGKLATFAPQVVVSLLDLAVDTTDITGKAEWVQRIRKLNGQRDPNKAPTPEEQAADAEAAAKQKAMEDMQVATARAQLALVLSKVNDTNAARVLKNLQGLLSAVEAASTVIAMPGVAGPADGLAKAAGFQDAATGDGAVIEPPPQDSPQTAPGAASFPAAPAA